MTTALTINIVLGAAVLTAVIGMLLSSIATQNADVATRIVRIAPPPAPAHAVAREARRTHQRSVTGHQELRIRRP